MRNKYDMGFLPQTAAGMESKTATKWRGMALALLSTLVGTIPVASDGAVKTKCSAPYQTKNVRFTPITPYCIRIEYSPDGRFVDAPSYFAINRDAVLKEYTVETVGNSVVIDTGKIHLVYTNDGKPLGASNLKAKFKVKDGAGVWSPGMPNPGNLGGVYYTLDGWTGTRQLNDGLASRDGWSLIDDSQGALMGEDGWMKPRPEGAGTDWYFFGYGHDYRAAMQSFAAISGPVPIPRKQLLGSWYSRWWPYSSDEFRQIAKEYNEHDFPLDVMVMDMDWHQVKFPEYNQENAWTCYNINRELLPDFEQLVQDLHEEDIAVTLNDHPTGGVQPFEECYRAVANELGYPPSYQKTIPFNAADKRFMEVFWKYTHQPYYDKGMDFWWIDWQQDYWVGNQPGLTHNQWLNQLFFEKSKIQGRRGANLSRFGGWGDHRHPVNASCDAFSSWDMLAFEVPFTALSGNSGCFFWSHEIGGFHGEKNEENYTRWYQFGAMSPVMRAHSTRSPDLDKRPWKHPEFVENSIRISMHLRAELMPYFYTSVAQACRDTVPFVRPMYYDYDVDAAYKNPQQYLLGDHMLVAPITTPGQGDHYLATQSVWFPDGPWYNLFTSERFDAGEFLVAADINEFPIYARGGVPLPMQPYTPRMGSAPLKTLNIRCYPGTDGQTGTFSLYEDDGISTGYEKGEFRTTELRYAREGRQTTVTILPAKGHFAHAPALRDYSIELPCTARAESITVNGQPAKGMYDEENKVNFVKIPRVSVSKRMVVKVITSDIDPSIFSRRAFLRRTGIKEAQPPEDFPKMVFSGIKGTTDDEAKTILAAAGIGFLQKNSHPYLWSRRRILSLYDNHGLLKGFGKWMNGAEVSPEPGRPARYALEDALGTTFAASPSRKYAEALAKIDIQGRMLAYDSSRPVRFDFDGNLATTATLTASMVDGKSDDSILGATDGIVGGYPGNRNEEWAANGKDGQWLQLDWPKAVTVDRVWLFDRINRTDHILSGTLAFSDGSEIEVGALPNDAATAREVSFKPIKTKWIRFSPNQCSPQTQNVGLAEIVVLPPDFVPGDPKASEKEVDIAALPIQETKVLSGREHAFFGIPGTVRNLFEDRSRRVESEDGQTIQCYRDKGNGKYFRINVDKPAQMEFRKVRNPVYVTIVFRDDHKGEIKMFYDADSTVAHLYKEIESRIICTGDGQWKSRTFKLEDARFAQRGYAVGCAFECTGFPDLQIDGIYFWERAGEP